MNISDLTDLIQPLIIEKAEDFSPRAAKARFERVSALLSGQAFWLSIFEFLERHGEAVEGVKFMVSNAGYKRGMGVADMMSIVPRPGAAAAALAKAEKSAPSAFSKARGKIPSMDVSRLMGVAGHALPKDGVATLTRREDILSKALGADLYGLRRSRLEAKELDAETAGVVAAALSGRRSNRL